GHGRHFQPCRLLVQRLQLRCPVQHRVLGANVQMGEGVGHGSSSPRVEDGGVTPPEPTLVPRRPGTACGQVCPGCVSHPGRISSGVRTTPTLAVRLVLVTVSADFSRSWHETPFHLAGYKMGVVTVTSPQGRHRVAGEDAYSRLL